MTCSSCTSSVETALKGVPGITNASVSLATETCKIEFDRTLIGPREMVDRIEELGFDAMLSDQENATQIQSLTRTKEIQEWYSRVMYSMAFAIPVFFINMIAPHLAFLAPIVNYRLLRGIYLGDVLVFLLTTPAQFWIGAKFYRNAYKSLKHGNATMDVLVMLGTSAAYFYSLLAMIFATTNPAPDFRPFTFFETSTMLIMFVSVGRYLENKAKGRTSAALTDLMALTPSMATIYTNPACTAEKKIPTELVQVGDTVKIVPGDKVPADGTVVRGSSSVDESAVTGEPVPVLKQRGDSVIGGTVNGLGTFDMLVMRAGKDTALAQIVKLVEEAQTSKAPIQAYADRVAGFFVPAVISLATFTFLTWIVVSALLVDDNLPAMFHRHGASKLAVCLQICISVIVVACPCALGLSTPTAIMVGTGVGAKNGILIKSGGALEASSSIKKIVVDKTGTVTRGKLTVAGLAWLPSNDRSGQYHDESASLSAMCADGRTTRADVIAMLSATEARSEHPLAKAVAVYGKDLLTQFGGSSPEPIIENFESVVGQGVKATISLSGSKYTLLVGNARFVTKSQETAMGRTVIYVSIGASNSIHSLPVMAISLSDAPRPSSAHAIKALHSMGIQVYMMTGDGKITADAVAKQVGINPENVVASLSPKGKASLVTDLIEEKNGGVAMVSYLSLVEKQDFYFMFCRLATVSTTHPLSLLQPLE
jgi:Cu+-exporting ATPase